MSVNLDLLFFAWMPLILLDFYGACFGSYNVACLNLKFDISYGAFAQVPLINKVF
jgi:hypothetical protein